MTKMSNSGKKSGFTLIELLVVIAIILIGSSIIFIGGSSGDGAKLSSAQRIISGIAQGARGQALLKSKPSRLIIYSEAPSNAEADKKLRFFGIVRWDEGWKAATQGTYLPEGIYFNPDLGDSAGVIPTMSLEYPRRNIGGNTDRASGGGGDEYYFYEFKSNGTMASSNSDTQNTDFANSWLALQAGVLKPDSDGKLTVRFPADDPSLESLENLKAGIIFRRVGSITFVTDPEDID